MLSTQLGMMFSIPIQQLNWTMRVPSIKAFSRYPNQTSEKPPIKNLRQQINKRLNQHFIIPLSVSVVKIPPLS